MHEFKRTTALIASAILTMACLARVDAKPPNIAILLTDQQRADAMSIAGTPGAHTPTMDALAREGVWFTHAFCATPQCSPARAALLTGLYPHRTGVMGNVNETKPTPAGQSPALDPKIPSLGKLFAAAGYETAYFGKWHLGGKASDHGFLVDGSGRNDGPTVTNLALAFLDKRKSRAPERKPLFLVASWINPHDIYHINRAQDVDPARITQVHLPESLDDDLRAKPFPQRHYLAEDQGKLFRRYTRPQWRRYIAFYHQLTTRVDAEVGQVVRALRDIDPQTLIVFTSDHGDLGGAHGLPYKGPAMYDELIRVPLIISWPGRIRPGVSSALVSHLDLLPTLCAIANIDPPAHIDGESLRPLLQSPTGSQTRLRNEVVMEYYGKQHWRVPIRMVRTREWKYVRYAGYGEELYNLGLDPHERKNLIHQPEHESERKRLSRQLDDWIERTDDPFAGLTVTDRRGEVLSSHGVK